MSWDMFQVKLPTFKINAPSIAPGDVGNIAIPNLVFNPVCPAGFSSLAPNGKVGQDDLCWSKCEAGFMDMGIMCQKNNGWVPIISTKKSTPPISQTIALTPLIGSNATPANATPKQTAAYQQYRDANAYYIKIQTDYEAASKDYNDQVRKYQDLKANLEALYKIALETRSQAGFVNMPSFIPGSEDKARDALAKYEDAARTINILSGKLQQKDRTPANDRLAKDSLPNLRNAIGNIFTAREDSVQKFNAAVAAIAVANTEAAEAAARNAKSKNDAAKAEAAKKLADAQAALAAAAAASGAAAARAASGAAAARAANMTTITREEVRAGQRQISKQSSNPNSSGKCPNDMMLLDGKCWTKCPAGFIDSGLFCVEMAQGGLQQQPAVLAPVKNNTKKITNLVKENIERVRTHAAMLGGYGKKGRSTRHSKKGVQPRKKRNSGKKTYRRKL